MVEIILQYINVSHQTFQFTFQSEEHSKRHKEILSNQENIYQPDKVFSNLEKGSLGTFL